VTSVSRRARLTLAVGGATRFLAGILMGTAMAVYVDRGGGTAVAVGAVAAAYFLGMTVFAPVWGAVADVTGRRRAVLAVTGLGATLAVLPLTLVPGPWAQIGLRGTYAVFAVGVQPVLLGVASERGGDEGRGRSIGEFNSARGAGFATGNVLAGVLLGAVLPTALYGVVAGVSLLSTAVAVLAVPGGGDGRDPSVAEVLGEVRRRLVPTVDDREHLRTNGLGWLYVALALRNTTVLGVVSLMPVYLTRSVGVAEATMGALLALNPASQAVFMYLFGRVADRLGRVPLVVAGMAGSGVFALVSAAATVPADPGVRFWLAAGAFVVIAASFSSMTTGALAFIGDVAPPRRQSELMGLRSTAKGVGGVLGPPLVGGVAALASYRTAFLVASVLAFVAAATAATALVETRTPTPAVAPGDD
jgi:MFS family permease